MSDSRHPARIALVEDDPIVGESLRDRLELEDYFCQWFDDPLMAMRTIPSQRFDLLLCDIKMPRMNGETFLTELQKTVPDLPPIIFITGHGTIEQAVRLLHQGAADFLTKPLDIPNLLARISNIIDDPLSIGSENWLDDVSPGLRPLVIQIDRLLPHPEVVILICGESGVGKEVLARQIHRRLTPTAPFEALNCAALPESLAANELFGHEKGAFTGAAGRHPGAFERAEDGVLFLDEIGDMPLDLQTQLLRVIQEREYLPFGATGLNTFSGRLVCATHHDLLERVRAGHFREDLYYRLNVVPFTIPPLRERHSDIAWLTERFIADNAKRAGQVAPPILEEEAHNALLGHTWPGNVRELKNVIDRACIFFDGKQLSVANLDIPVGSNTISDFGLRESREQAELQRVEKALISNEYKIQRTADSLGISRKTLWEKMRKFSLEKPE